MVDHQLATAVEQEEGSRNAAQAQYPQRRYDQPLWR